MERSIRPETRPGSPRSDSQRSDSPHSDGGFPTSTYRPSDGFKAFNALRDYSDPQSPLELDPDAHRTAQPSEPAGSAQDSDGDEIVFTPTSGSIRSNHPPRPAQSPPDRSGWGSPPARNYSHAPHYAQRARRPVLSPKERAMWKWANCVDLDGFLTEAYEYYTGKGIYSIILGRALNLATVAFMVAFVTYLSMCINYSALPHSTTFEQIRVKKCFYSMSWFYQLSIWAFAFGWACFAIKYFTDIPRLRDMHDFYDLLLGIPDADIQTVPWGEVTKAMINLTRERGNGVADLTPDLADFLKTQSKEHLEEGDIANRIMRRQNYMIGLIHHGIINFNIDIPFIGKYTLMTKTTEWLIDFVVFNYVFDQNGQLRREFMDQNCLPQLEKGLNARFRLIGLMSVVLCPVVAVFYCLAYFFRYFVEFRSNPGELGKRAYTTESRWKFREYNELIHNFEDREDLSRPLADAYLAQFPKDKVAKVARFVEFVSGAFATVLVLASLLDPDMFLGFELTENRTVLFYLGVFTAIYAAAHASSSSSKTRFHPTHSDGAMDDFQQREEDMIKNGGKFCQCRDWDPLSRALGHVRYMPPSWVPKLYTDDVRKQFSQMYQLRIVLFLEDLFSILIAPYLLLNPKARVSTDATADAPNSPSPLPTPISSRSLVEFFHENTVKVRGLGYVSIFAVDELSAYRDYKNKLLSSAGQAALKNGERKAGLVDESDDEDGFQKVGLIAPRVPIWKSMYLKPADDSKSSAVGSGSVLPPRTPDAAREVEEVLHRFANGRLSDDDFERAFREDPALTAAAIDRMESPNEAQLPHRSRSTADRDVTDRARAPYRDHLEGSQGDDRYAAFYNDQERGEAGSSRMGQAGQYRSRQQNASVRPMTFWSIIGELVERTQRRR